MTTAEIHDKVTRLKAQSEAYKKNLLQLQRNLHALHKGLASFKQDIAHTENNFLALVEGNTNTMAHAPSLMHLLPEDARLLAV
ncbi:hypothetical protein [Mucilaginibacter lacusdianchii]|uniref:hypothetical protein n=1 Tax=Mucilaginibacter lacusdianchii TaxID=2684211 RepID=UPI00131BE767|nr:hypothetical protein [Mucilaginibacter sp. JXJ CY 39]